jgi:O-antigen/teichoic acid export membrane protein
MIKEVTYHTVRMPLAGRIAYNVAYNAVAKVLSTILALIILGFLTRYLGKDGFGNYATVLAFFAFFNALGDLGLPTVAAREISRPDADENRIMSSILSLRLLVSLAVVGIAPLINVLFPYADASMRDGIFLAALAFFFSSFSMTLNGIFQKHLVMDRVATVELAGKLVQLGIVLIAIRFDLGFSVIVSALLGYMLFNALLVFSISRRYFVFTPSFDRAHWRELLQHSLPLGVASIVTFAYFKADTILLSRLTTAADVGIYGAAYKVIENLVFFPAMVAGLVLPVLSRFAFTDRKKFTVTADKLLKVFAILVIPLTIGVFALAPTIIRIIGGADFEASVDVLRVLVFTLVFIFLGQFFNTLLIVNNLQGKLMKALIAAAIFNVSLNLIVIPRFSYFGAAASSVVTEMLVATFSFLIVKKYAAYRPHIDRLSTILFSGAVMGSFLFLTASIHFVWQISGSILVYFATLWFAKGIAKEEITHILAGRQFVREKK